MQKLNWKPLFEYLDDRFGEMEARFDEMGNRISALTNAVDTALKIGKDNKEEITGLNYRVGIHDKRIGKAEKKLNISYKP